MDYIKLSFYKTNSFVFKPKAFWMLYLNDHLYIKLMCLLWAMNFWCRTAGFAHLNTFTVGIMSNHKYWVFHPIGGIYYCLLLPNTSFFYHFIQPCDSIGCRPTVSSPPNQLPNAVLIFNHALTLIQCDVPVHMQCNA